LGHGLTAALDAVAGIGHRLTGQNGRAFYKKPSLSRKQERKDKYCVIVLNPF
jgi:hypothetical protein